MPIHTNTIDTYQFEDLRGSLQPRSEELEVIARPGKDDTTVRLTGVRGRPCQLLSVHWVEDFEAAGAALSAYVLLKDGNSYPITQHSVDFGEFRILDVVEVQAVAAMSAIGTIISNPTVLQICQWTVQHVPA